MKSLAIHSHKGGVGKTTIAVNIAIMLAQRGKNVCLIDFDFAGPNLYTFFEGVKIPFLNEFFWQDRGIEECLYDVKENLGLEGSLFVGFADPSSESITATLEIDNQGAMKMLQDTLRMKNVLRKKPYQIDYLIFDNTPGLSMINVNSFLATDSILVMIKFSSFDIEGTVHLISGLIDVLNNETTLLANNIPQDYLDDKGYVQELEDLVVKDIRDKTDVGINFLGWLPTDDSLQKAEFVNAAKNLRGQPTSRTIHAITEKDHSLVNNLSKVVDKLIG